MAALTIPSQPVSMHENRDVFITTRIKCLLGFSSSSRRRNRDTSQESKNPTKSSKTSCIETGNVKQESRFPGSRRRMFSIHSEDVSVSPASPVSPARLSVRKDLQSPSATIGTTRVFLPPSISVRPQVLLTTTQELKTCNSSSACFKALNIPEILECILSSFVDLNDNIPLRKSSTDEIRELRHGPLYSCLTVSSVFYATAVRLLSRRVALSSLEQIQAYSATSTSKDNLCRDLLIHRVKACQQSHFQQISQFRLRTLELYVCPKLVPTEQMLSSGTLRKLALPGCALVDDDLIRLVARLCPALQILDLRACELVSDEGILAIARSSTALSYLNVGRVNGAEAITDKSIMEICKNTAVETLGLAGCAISDETVLAIAQYRGTHIERLSMNQCRKVSDLSLCQLLRSAPRLQVLEIVGCERTKDAKTLCYFKISTGALVETSEVFALEMQLYEREVRHELEHLRTRLLKSQRRVTT